MILSHQIRLDPTAEQAAYFVRACGTARFTYNWALAEWKKRYANGEKPKGNELKKQFNSIRHEQFPWSGEVHRDCTSQPFANLQKAFSKFFSKKAKYPKFKKKNGRASFYVANDQFSLRNAVVRLPIIGNIKLREALRFDGKIMSATVSRKAHQWLLAVQVDVGDYAKSTLPNRREVIGVDLGVKHLATLSTGEKIEGPKALVKATKRLAYLSKAVSRKVKGSENRGKAKEKLARQHLRVAEVRKDAMHKLTTRLLRENQTVVIEDLNVKGMCKLRSLGRRVADQAFGEFRRQLTYKALIFKANVVVASRWFPSSKTCSTCGAVKDSLPLSQREFACDSCGVVEDRDVNAAVNLEQLGAASAEVTLVDKEALAAPKGAAKLTWMKQEFRSAHL